MPVQRFLQFTQLNRLFRLVHPPSASFLRQNPNSTLRCPKRKSMYSSRLSSSDDSQEAFAQKISSTQSNVSKMLNGTPPSAATLKALATVYKVSVDWLLGLSDKKNRRQGAVPRIDRRNDYICGCNGGS